MEIVMNGDISFCSSSNIDDVGTGEHFMAWLNFQIFDEEMHKFLCELDYVALSKDFVDFVWNSRAACDAASPEIDRQWINFHYGRMSRPRNHFVWPELKAEWAAKRR